MMELGRFSSLSFQPNKTMASNVRNIREKMPMLTGMKMVGFCAMKKSIARYFTMSWVYLKMVVYHPPVICPLKLRWMSWRAPIRHKKAKVISLIFTCLSNSWVRRK